MSNTIAQAYLPSGFSTLDAALGGGYPEGRVVELFGPEDSGQIGVALAAIAAAQAAGHTAAFVDADSAFFPSDAAAAGVDLAALLVTGPDDDKGALEAAEVLVRSGAVRLVVVALRYAETEGAGAHARMMSTALRSLTAMAHKTGATVIFLTPLRQRIGIVFGAPLEAMPGGNALKFYASVRAEVRRVDGVPRVKVLKNKCGPIWSTTELPELAR